MRQLIALILCAFSAASFAQTLQTVTTNGSTTNVLTTFSNGLNVSGGQLKRTTLDMTYSGTRHQNPTGYPSELGLSSGTEFGGFTYYNDGNTVVSLGISQNSRLVATVFAPSNSYKQFQIHGSNTNQMGYGMVLRNNGTAATTPTQNWYTQNTSNNLFSVVDPLNIGVSGNNDVKFYATSSTDINVVPAMTIKGGTQNIGINTAPSANYKLAIDGDAIATKMVVKAKSAWPDYVFKPNYELTPLSKIAHFIKENGHLPEIPTEKEVTENGIDLGSMETKLLKKVEELTLYLIEQQKTIEKQQLQIDELVKKMKN